MNFKLFAVVAALFVCFLKIADASAAILVVAPHPDDEALMFSGVIHSALQSGEEVKLVVITNGDYYGVQRGYIREGETIAAMAGVLGMKESDIIFLGYPDAGLKTIYDLYTAADQVFTSRAGQTQTYGNRGLGNMDYHTYKFGTSGKYNTINILLDLKSIIGDYQPQHIFLTNEYDTHSDHATAYRLVRDALLDLAGNYPDYRPVIHHTMIHGGSESIWPTQAGPDPSAIFTAPPVLSSTPLKWTSRESINVPPVMQSKLLSENLKHLAIISYVSQVDPYLRSFVHKDEFFWPENLYSTNSPPVANAGADRVVSMGTTVTLDGTASHDLNNDLLEYSWKQIQGKVVTLTNPTSATPSFIAPAEATSLIFKLTVSDGKISSYPVTVTVTVTGDQTLPSPWKKQDIGMVGLAGDSVYLNDTFTVRGSGADIWANADAFHYTYRTLTGNGQIIARVASLQNTNSWAKAGVMIRASLSANSSHAFMAITPGNGTAFQRRLTSGAATLHTSGPKVTAPYWVKLKRDGDIFTAHASKDGVSWTLVGSEAIDMADSVLVGLAVSSTNNAALCTATMDGVSVAAAVTPPTVIITAPGNDSTFKAPATIPISFTATAGTAAEISRVDFYAGTTLIGSGTTAPFTWNEVAAGNYSLTAKVTDSLGNSAVSAPVNVNVVVDSTFPSSWSRQDIGNVALAGETTYLNDVFTLKGSGTDIWANADAFHYAYKTMSGDGQIIARVSSLQQTNAWAKGGVMIRAGLAANSPHAMMAITAGNGAAFQRRLTAGGASLHTAGWKINAPYWVKLVRSGNTFTGYISQDGLSWVLVGKDTISMAGSALVGFAVTSHDNSTLCAATLDNVSVSGVIVPPTVNITAPADGASFTAPATITITATATGGTDAGVSRVDFYAGTMLLGSATAAPYSLTWHDAPAGTSSLTAKVIDTLGGTAASAPVTVTIVATSMLPSPWAKQDIGSVGLPGDAVYQNGIFTLSGSGFDIWDKADAFQYTYKSLGGDGQIVARVASLQNTNAWAKAGVMIRASLAANSPHALMAITPGNGAAFQRRRTAGAASLHTAGPKVNSPYWVKLVRSGNLFTGYVSADGISWTLVGTDTVSMASSVLVGLAVTSHNNTALCTVAIDGVE